MLDACVIDTDVLSYLLKGDSRAGLYRPYFDSTNIVISFMSIAELERWAIERAWGEVRRRQLRRFLDAFVTRPVDRALCETWAVIMAEARRRGTPIAHADAWIAATATLESLPLVTHNARHFAAVSGLTIQTASSS